MKVQCRCDVAFRGILGMKKGSVGLAFCGEMTLLVCFLHYFVIMEVSEPSTTKCCNDRWLVVFELSNDQRIMQVLILDY